MYERVRHTTTRRDAFPRGLIGVALAVLTLTAAACSSTTATSTTSTTTTKSTTSTTTTTPSTTSTSSTTTTTPGPAGGIIPADFQPSSFTAVSLDEWWLLGTAHCLTGSGTCEAIVRTTNGGASFKGIPSPPNSSGWVTQLRFANPLDGYAFGPKLWQTTNRGASWVKVATPGVVAALEVADGDAYALECATGANCVSMQLLRSGVGSSEWQRIATPTLEESAPDQLWNAAILAVSGSDLYVFNDVGRGVLLFSGDRGTRVVERPDPCTAGLGGSPAPAADGSSTIWAACPTGTEAGAWISNNGGTTWRSASARTAGFPNRLALTAASSSVALAWPGPDISDAALARTTNGGGSYSGVLSSAWTVSWAGFSDPARAYALAGKAGVTGPMQLLKSNDGGATWSQVVIKS